MNDGAIYHWNVVDGLQASYSSGAREDQKTVFVTNELTGSNPWNHHVLKINTREFEVLLHYESLDENKTYYIGGFSLHP